MSALDELTTYFVTTDRVTAPRALAALEAQNLPRPIELVRNVRPLAAAYGRSLACQTEYCAIIDDDVALQPGFLQKAVEELIHVRRSRPDVFILAGIHFTDRDDLIAGRGVALYHVPSLRKVGFPDVPHVARRQRAMAEAMGMSLHGSAHVVGERLRGSTEDIYKRFLWFQLRWLARLDPWYRRFPPSQTLIRAVATNDRDHWAAAMGTIDATLAGDVPTSKDELFRGPLGATVDFESATVAQCRRLVLGAMPRFVRAYLPSFLGLAAEEAARQGMKAFRKLRSG